MGIAILQLPGGSTPYSRESPYSLRERDLKELPGSAGPAAGAAAVGPSGAEELEERGTEATEVVLEEALLREHRLREDAHERERAVRLAQVDDGAVILPPRGESTGRSELS